MRNTAETYDLLGDIHEAQGSFLEAIHNYQEAVRLDPESDKFAFDLGTELILHENHAAALAVFHSAAQRFSKSSRIFLGLGMVQFLTGKTDESVSAFLKAVDLNPAFEPAYLFLGEACTFSGTCSTEVAAKLATLATKEPNNFGAQYHYGAVLVHEMNQDGDLEHAADSCIDLWRCFNGTICHVDSLTRGDVSASLRGRKKHDYPVRVIATKRDAAQIGP